MSNVVSLKQFRIEKEIRKEMETVHPHTDWGGPVNLPSLDDYDGEVEEWWVDENWLWDPYGLFD